METYVHLLYMAELLLQSEMFQKNVVEKIKTHILCSITFFSENRAVYEIMWKSMVETARPQIAIYYGPSALHAG